MPKDKAPLFGQIAFYLTGLSFFWIGIALYYGTRESNTALAKCAKSGAIMGLILDVLGIILLIVRSM